MKKVVLRTFIVIKYQSSLTRFEPTNLVSNGKRATYKTVEGDKL
jgi:hypothetical protein